MTKGNGHQAPAAAPVAAKTAPAKVAVAAKGLNGRSRTGFALDLTSGGPESRDAEFERA